MTALGRVRSTGAWRSPQRVFLVIALTFGLGFIVVTPALSGYDESIHVTRAWSISNGHFIATRQYVDGHLDALVDKFPKALVDDLVMLQRLGGFNVGRAGDAYDHFGDAAPADKPTMLVDFRSAAIYPPLPYAPAALAMRAGNAAGFSLLATLLLARFAQLCAYILLVMWSIRRAPRHRWLLCALAITPVALFQAAMISGDGITIGFALATIAVAAALAQPNAPSRRLIIEAALVVVGLGLCKPPYVVLALLFVPAIIRHWKPTRARAITIGMAVGPGIVSAALWMRYAQSVYLAPSFPYSPAGGFAYHDVDSKAQLRFVLRDPISFVAVLARTALRSWAALTHDSVAQVVAWDQPLFANLAVGVVVILAIFGAAHLQPAASGASATRAPRERTVGLAVATIGSFAVCVLAYAGWNAVRAPRIDEMQGRYLFPFIAVALYACAPGSRQRRARRTNAFMHGAARLAIPMLVAVELFTVLGIANHYY